MPSITREDLAARDAADPLKTFRDRFDIPDGVIYLDGNSLGPLLNSVRDRVSDVVSREWGQDLITSWNKNHWMELAARIGAKLAPMIGAEAHEVLAADSTSINIFKLLSAGLKMRPGRKVILSEAGNFPTDLYMAEGLVSLLGGAYSLRLMDKAENLADFLDDDVAVVMITQVDYRTGRKLHMTAVTRQVQDAGALMLWDLAHSAGAFPVDLNGAKADFAVGCGYKYLNGGPGAPAFLFVADRHQATIQPALSGWLGHANPFAFTNSYAPANGIARHTVGTPPVLSMSALDEALSLFADVAMEDLLLKSRQLTGLFITLVEQECAGFGLELATPREDAARGSQVSFRSQNGYPIMQALIARKVIGDFRDPDIMRFGFAPLYISYTDVWDAVAVLRDVLETGAWDASAFKQRAAVT